MSDFAEQFNKDGFLVLKEFNTPSACDALIKRAEELASGFETKGHASVFQTTDQAKTTDEYFLNSGEKISFFFEKDAFDAAGNLKGSLFQSLNKIGHALHDLDPVFNAFSHSEQLKSISTQLMMQNHVLIQSMYIMKHARIEGVVDIHQDASFLYTEPISCIGFWFALEDANINNGCLWAAPGGHKTALRSWFRRKPEGGTEMFFLNNTAFSMEGMQPLEVKKGDCIVLHGLLPHYSLPNTSGKSRQAYSIHTISSDAVYPENNWLRRKSASLKGFNG